MRRAPDLALGPSILAVALLALLAYPAPAQARVETGDWELGAHLGRTRFLESDELDNTGFWGLNAGYALNDIFEIGVNFDTVDTESKDRATDARFDFLTLDFIFNGGKDAHRPFLLIGVGNLDHSRRMRTPTGTRRVNGDAGLLDFGLGYRGYFNYLVGIRLDGRLYFTSENGNGFGFDGHDVRLSYGLVFNIHR